MGKKHTKNLLKYGQCEWEGCKNPKKPDQRCCDVHEGILNTVESDLNTDKAHILQPYLKKNRAN